MSQNTMTPARWYCVDQIGTATLCTSEKHALVEAEVGDKLEPIAAPHQAVLLGDVRALTAERDLLAAEVEAMRTRRGLWQPIESAPKDGTRVLIYMPESSRRKVQEAYWATPWEGAPDEQCWWSTPYGPAGRGYTILQKAVTHWQPLPAPPQELA